MIDQSDAEAALRPVRELVAADGGDVVLDAVTPDGVTLRLVLGTAECAECVMPRPFLETVAKDMMAPLLPDLSTVTIHDPREVEEDDDGA